MLRITYLLYYDIILGPNLKQLIFFQKMHHNNWII